MTDITSYGHFLLGNSCTYFIPEKLYNILFTIDDIWYSFSRYLDKDKDNSRRIDSNFWHITASYYKAFAKTIHAYAYYGEKRYETIGFDNITPIDKTFSDLIDAFRYVIEAIEEIRHLELNLQPEIVKLTDEKKQHHYKHLNKIKERVDNFVKHCYLQAIDMDTPIEKEN